MNVRFFFKKNVHISKFVFLKTRSLVLFCSQFIGMVDEDVIFSTQYFVSQTLSCQYSRPLRSMLNYRRGQEGGDKGMSVFVSTPFEIYDTRSLSFMALLHTSYSWGTQHYFLTKLS